MRVRRFKAVIETGRGGGVHILGIRKDIRSAIGKDIGDTVKLSVEQDTAERIVEVPTELAKALRRAKGAKKKFDGLSFTHRREHAEMVAGAKKDETREQRIAKILSELSKS